MLARVGMSVGHNTLSENDINKLYTGMQRVNVSHMKPHSDTPRTHPAGCSTIAGEEG